MFLTIEHSGIINKTRTRSSIAFENMCFWCLFLGPHLTTHRSDIRVSYWIIAAKTCTANMDAIVECTPRVVGVSDCFGDFSSHC